MNKRELTTAEKWADVDRIINNIETRRERGDKGCETYLDKYVDVMFNRKGE